MMLRFHQHPPEIFALAQLELNEVIADAETRAGTEDFDLPEKIVAQRVSLIQVFMKKNIFRYFVKDFLPAIKLVSELRKECPHIEGRRHTVGATKIDGRNEPGRGVIGILSKKNILRMEISMSLYQLLRVLAV